MTPAELDAIEARAQEAVEGPWVYRSWNDWPYDETDLDNGERSADVLTRDGDTLVECRGYWGACDETAMFISHARTDVPALVAEVRRLRAALEAAKIEHFVYESPDYDHRCEALLGPSGKCDCGAAEHNRKIDEAMA